MSGAKGVGHQLRKAARDGDVQTVKDLIKEGVDLDLKDRRSWWTALHHAADGDNVNHYHVANLLVQAGANINSQDRDGNTPLHLAAQRGDSAMIGLILTAKPTAGIANKKGYTALMVVPKERTELTMKILNWERSSQGHVKLFGRTRMNPNAVTGIGEERRHREGRAEREEELREAAADGDVDGVKEVLTLHPDINIDAQDEKGWSALHFSAFRGHSEIVTILLKKDVNPNLQEKMNLQTPLHLAAASGSSRTVEALLTLVKSYRIDGEDRLDQTPLFIAASKGHVEVTRVLLEHDADCTVADRAGRTPLFIAALEGHEGVVKAILASSKSGNSLLNMNVMDASGKTALHAAAQEGNVEVGRLLILAGGDLEARDGLGATPLFVASEMGHTRCVKMMLESGANPNNANSNWETPLYVASKKGHVAVVRGLLEHKADTEQPVLDGFTPLMAAAQEGRIAVMSQLVSHNAAIHAANNNGETPLLIAAVKGYNNAVAFLIQNGAHILEANVRGQTALHLAAANGHTGVVRVLLAALESKVLSKAGRRASRDHLRPDTRGETALHLASKNGHMSVVEELLYYDKKITKASQSSSSPGVIYGAMIDVPNKFGWTALHSAVDGLRYGSVSVLLHYNANMNAPDTFGNTPLHVAARHQDGRLVGMLLSAGVDIGAVNGRGRTALHFASSCVRPNTLRMLLDDDADPHAQDKQGLNAHGVINSQKGCNPMYALEDLCVGHKVKNTTFYSGNMCPVVVGTENAFREADLLLRVAMNKSYSKPISNVQEVLTAPQNHPSSNPVNIPLAATLAPAAFLVLFFLAILLALYRRVQKKKAPAIKRDNGKADRGEKVELQRQRDSESYYLQPGEAASQGLPSLPKKVSFLDTQSERHVLSHGSDFFDDAVNSQDWAYVASQPCKAASEMSSGGDSCGWSDSSEDRDDKDDSARIRSGQRPKSRDHSVVRISNSTTIDEDLTQCDNEDQPLHARGTLGQSSSGVNQHGKVVHRSIKIGELERQWSWS